MLKIRNVLLFIVILASGCAPLRCNTHIEADEKLILVTLQDQKENWICDGACETNWIRLPAIQKIVWKYKQDLIPIFINNLDNSTPSQITLEGKPISVGCICFDLLCSIIVASDLWVISDCYYDDGFWASNRKEFWVDPNSKMKEIKSVQKRWIAAFNAGKLSYDSKRAELGSQ